MNQTTQMHQIARALPEVDAYFTPYFVEGLMDVARRLDLIEFTIGGNKVRRRCLDYLTKNRLQIDLDAKNGPYDLVVTCTDQTIQRRISPYPIVLVQEGILDPRTLMYQVCKQLRFVPRYLASTSTTGLSFAYRKFCVASEGYKDHFAAMGIDRDLLEVTGIPNFDDCERYKDNRFPHQGYVLACLSDTRETFKLVSRRRFIERAVEIAAGRQLIFKLHPNEDLARGKEEIAKLAPGALVYTEGSAEEMIANCDVLLCQYSSTVFVGLALGKECYSYFPIDELKRLLPLQNKSAARHIARVCRELLAEEKARQPIPIDAGRSREPTRGATP